MCRRFLSPHWTSLAASYERYRGEDDFTRELQFYLRDYVGRPTPLYFAERLTDLFGGAKIYLKREDLCHTGAHKLNNVMGQILLARRMGKPRIIAETGAGQHGVATATACALFGLKCQVYMGVEDMERQALNVFRMRLLGAEVAPVTSGTQTLKDATSEAIRDWVTNVRDTHYIIGSVVGPHPYPMMVRDFQSVDGRETRAQILEKEGRLPDYIIACVGGGSNAMGIFYPFVEDKAVKLIGVEAAGQGVDSGRHCATLNLGSPGVLHGSMSYLCRATTAKSSSPTAFPPASTTPASAPSTAISRTAGGRITDTPPIARRWRLSISFREPKGSFPRSNHLTPSPTRRSLPQHWVRTKWW